MGLFIKKEYKTEKGFTKALRKASKTHGGNVSWHGTDHGWSLSFPKAKPYSPKRKKK